MKKLSELYKGLPDILIKDIKTNSKEVNEGDLFVCIKGVVKDRNEFIGEAIKRGAKALVTNIPVIYVDNPNEELAKVCSEFYNHPEEKLDLIGITGTNGKTTAALIIKDLLGNTCGYLGTNGVICTKFNEKIQNTTPNSDKLFKYLDRFYKAGCKFVSMEASSEAFLHNRLNKIMFKVGIVTNITEDHLNVHKTIENYVSCKKKIVDHIKKDGVLILNTDDKYYEEFRNINCKILTYGKNNADLEIVSFNEYIDKTDITVKYKNKLYNITSPLLGEFNVYNLCTGILTLVALGNKLEEVIPNIKNIKTPSGRLEFIKHRDYYIILDYAHTPDAFIKVYSFLNKVKKGRIITVTGSAGGREKEKRGEMGRIILENSDYVIFTMDDPRNERVNDIIDDLLSKTNKTNYERIIKRDRAIKKALELAKSKDIILIAGKGDDNYMAIDDKYLHYSDRETIKNIIDIM